MRVLEAVYSLELGGIERLVSGLAPQLSQVHGCPTAVVCLGSRSGPLLAPLEAEGIPVFSALRAPGGQGAWMERLGGVFKEWQPDVYHTHYSFGLLWQVRAAVRAGVKRIVITEQNAYRMGLGARLRNLVYDRLYWPRLHAYTCVSEAVRRHVARLRWRSERDFDVVYNCADVELFRPDPVRRMTARQAWGVSSATFVVGSAGRLVEQKGFGFLIAAASRVCVEAPNVQFRVFGEGADRDRLARQIASLGLQSKIFLEGSKSHLEELLPGLDLYVMPSLWEGMSLAIAEAMASRLPIIGTAVPGTTELLAEDAGVVVPPGEPGPLADAVLALLTDKPRRDLLAETAYRRAHRVFSMQRCAEAYLEIFRRSGENAPSPRPRRSGTSCL